MLQIRVFGSAPLIGNVAERLRELPGAAHVSIADGAHDGSALVTADVRAAAADAALKMVDSLGVVREDVALLRLDAIGTAVAADDGLALVSADLLRQAQLNARAAVRYLVFMAVAGVIAAFGVIEQDQVLIVGAMAVSPDVLPVTATCTGIVLRRWRLACRGLASLLVGLATASVFSALVAAGLRLFDLLPDGFALHESGFAAQQHVNAETVLVAFAAGVGGMLAVETRASMAVGVAISVTTIPAAAFLGVAAGVGELSDSLGALAVLATNIAMMVSGGSIALALQRGLQHRSA
jgi:uncharacterized hydrophobic protein (TIGR00271 family)